MADGFVDVVNPTLVELRRWALAGVEEPMQDWDLIVSVHEPGVDLLDLIEEEVQPAFFLSCLYIRAGDDVRGGRSAELVPLMRSAERRDHSWIRTWLRRTQELIARPSTFDHVAWCGGGLASQPE